jgi:hypothetical protein
MDAKTLTEEQANAIQIALTEADTFLRKLEQLSTTARPIRRDDILAPTLRMALNMALRITIDAGEAVPAAKRKK